MIDINEYLDMFPGVTLLKNGVTELKNILINIMPNIWSKQAYVHGFDCKPISKKQLTCLNAWGFWNISMKVYYKIII